MFNRTASNDRFKGDGMPPTLLLKPPPDEQINMTHDGSKVTNRNLRGRDSRSRL